MKKLVAIIILGVLTLSGCNKQEKEIDVKYEFTFEERSSETESTDVIAESEEINNTNINEDMTLSIEEIQALDMYAQKAEEDDKMKETLITDHDKYAGVYSSNIKVDIDKIRDIEIENKDWFKKPVSENYYYYYETYQYIIYALEYYFDNNIQDVYTCNIPEDIIETITNFIYKVQVHGEKSDILLSLDLHNQTILLEEISHDDLIEVEKTTIQNGIPIPDSAIKFRDDLNLIDIDENKLMLFKTESSKEQIVLLSSSINNGIYNVFKVKNEVFDEVQHRNTYFITFDGKTVYYLIEYVEDNVSYIIKENELTFDEIINNVDIMYE